MEQLSTDGFLEFERWVNETVEREGGVEMKVKLKYPHAEFLPWIAVEAG
jgi:hypothetical protein